MDRNPLRRPSDHAETIIGTVMALIFSFLIAWGLTRHVINRHHMAVWDAEWAAIEPRWGLPAVAEISGEIDIASAPWLRDSLLLAMRLDRTTIL